MKLQKRHQLHSLLIFTANSNSLYFPSDILYLLDTFVSSWQLLIHTLPLSHFHKDEMPPLMPSSINIILYLCRDEMSPCKIHKCFKPAMPVGGGLLPLAVVAPADMIKRGYV